MKKMIALFLAVIMCVSVAGCSADKKAFEMSKEAYEEVNYAYSIIKVFGADVYKAWYLGATEPISIQKNGISCLSSELSLTEEEIGSGIGYGIASGYGKNWEELSELEKEEFRNQADGFLKNTPNGEVLQNTLYAVPFSYKVNGKTEEVQQALDRAKELMKKLSGEYADYEHYPALKGFYTSASSYFEFCQKPTGTFEMLEVTVNEYMNEIRDYQNDLAFIFEES